MHLIIEETANTGAGQARRLGFQVQQWRKTGTFSSVAPSGRYLLDW